MKRNLKILGLLTMAVFAMTAMAASAAQAAGTFAWDSGTTTLTASAAGTQKFTTTAGTVECNEISGHATVSGTSATTLTATSIVYKNNGAASCPLASFGNATINMNGCDYLFHAGETEEGSTDSTVGTVDIVCPKGAAIEVTAPFGACTIKIAGQTGLSSVTFLANTGATPKDVDINPAVEKISYTHSGFACGSGSGTNGTYTGQVTIKGEDSAGKPTNVWVD
jgi:hypothetical protein